MKNVFIKLGKVFSNGITANIIAFLVLLFSVISTYVQQKEFAIQSNLVDSLNYKINSVTYQPTLVIKGKPKLKTFRFGLVIPKKLPKIKLDAKEPPTIEVSGKYELKAEITIVNQGQYLADIVAVGFCGKNDSTAVIRKLLKDSLSLKNSSPHYFSVFEKSQLLRGDSITLKLDYTFDDVVNDKTILHFLILYENQAGYLYDTYYWSLIENIPTLFEPEIFVKDKKVMMRYKSSDYPTTRDVFHCNITNQSYKIYNKTESEIIRNNINKYVYK